MISVCLVSYNGEKYIKKQIVSILQQTRNIDEIIISDNGSTDNTLKIIEEFRSLQYPVFIFHKLQSEANSKREQIIENVEFALTKANGDFIFLADQDDIWLPKKVEEMMKSLEQNTLVISDCIIINDDENIISNSFFELNHSSFRFPYDLIKNPYLGCAIAFRRELLEIALPFPESIPMHDIWLGNVAKYYFSIGVIQKTLMYYRRHNNNASTSGKKSRYNLQHKLKFRFQIIYNLIIYGFLKLIRNAKNS